LAPRSLWIPEFYLQIRRKKRADERTRTADLLITSELLYQLSYVGLFRAQSISQGPLPFTQDLRCVSGTLDPKDAAIMIVRKGEGEARDEGSERESGTSAQVRREHPG
jgi:hypothetical protein